VIATSFFDNAGHPLTLAIGVDCGPMVGKIVGMERSFWCLFGNPINTAARLASLSRKTMQCESSIAVVSATAAQAFRRVRSCIAQGTHRANKGENAGAGVGAGAGAGLDPGFVVESMGCHEVKGIGEVEVFSLVGCDPDGENGEQSDNLCSISEEGQGGDEQPSQARDAAVEVSDLYKSFQERMRVTAEADALGRHVRCPLRSPSSSPERVPAVASSPRVSLAKKKKFSTADAAEIREEILPRELTADAGAAVAAGMGAQGGAAGRRNSVGSLDDAYETGASCEPGALQISPVVSRMQDCPTGESLGRAREEEQDAENETLVPAGVPRCRCAFESLPSYLGWGWGSVGG
jgi:hypothetical protein